MGGIQQVQQSHPQVQSQQVVGMGRISQGKLAAFAVGTQKKSRFQKAREERELKKKQEEQEAASVYESFVASFAVEEDGKTFVR
jgi:U2-associated protein SR140